MSKKYVGLPGQIRYVEENIALRKKSGDDTSFEEELLKEWRRYLPGGDKRHLWLAHSEAARKSEGHPGKARSKPSGQNSGG